jgi:hypothetical protein
VAALVERALLAVRGPLWGCRQQRRFRWHVSCAWVADGANPLLEVFEIERQKKRKRTPFRTFTNSLLLTVVYLVVVEGRGLRSRRTREAIGTVGEGGDGAGGV